MWIFLVYCRKGNIEVLEIYFCLYLNNVIEKIYIFFKKGIEGSDLGVICEFIWIFVKFIVLFFLVKLVFY